MQRIDGRLPGERLGIEMDVKGNEIVVASTQRLLRLKGQKVAFEMSFPQELFAQRGVHVSFTADMDGDNRADILLGTPYAKVGRNSEAGQIQLIGSSSGKVLFVVQGRTRGEHMGEVLQPLDLSFGQRKN